MKKEKETAEEENKTDVAVDVIYIITDATDKEGLAEVY